MEQTNTAAAATKLLQSCLTLCDPIDGSPPGSPIPGILQARTLEWVAISFSNAWKWKVKVKSLSHVRLLAAPWTAAYQAPLSMGFPQQELLEWGAIAFSYTPIKLIFLKRDLTGLELHTSSACIVSRNAGFFFFFFALYIWYFLKGFIWFCKENGFK